ncbi:MAG: TolC family protein [Bacteroidales bacterium]|nr:TolC family protein [Bacteroidales bacterium]MBN2750402.1 TolC family protein [Bacteroidales bacterium]
MLKSIATPLLLILSLALSAQSTVNRLTLQEVLELAKEQSPQAIQAKHQFRSAYWQYRSYKAEYLPGVTFRGTLPAFSRQIVKHQNNEGVYSYVEENTNSISGGLSITQNIGITGGQVFVESNLERTDILGDNKTTSYLSVPVRIGFRQELFGFNELKWKKKIEPLKYLEAKRLYIDALEGISYKATEVFFDLILAQQNLATAKLNYANSDTLYKIAKGRYNIGTIAENDLLQMELKFLNAGNDVNDAEVELQLMKFKIKSFLGLNDQFDVELVIPSDFPKLKLNHEQVLAQAKQNNPKIVSYETSFIEAQKRVAQAKAQRGFRAELNANYGLTKSAETFDDAYINPIDQQRVNIGVTIPILDWGLGKGRVKMAQSNMEVTRTTVQQQIIDFEQNVFLEVMQFNQQDNQLIIASKADTISQLRYNVTKERFLIGKIDVLDLNVAQAERDQAKQKLIQYMREYWQNYFNMRRLTLYDFENNKPLSFDFEELIK